MDNDLEAVGTNAHELPMVYAALAKSDEGIRTANYKVLEDWNKLLRRQPEDRAARHVRHGGIPARRAGLGGRLDWIPAGQRRRSISGGEEIIDWWKAHGRDPHRKILIFSDGLDVDTIENTYNHFVGRVRMAFGWGTNLTNDFRNCAPIDLPGLTPISLVAKPSSANGRPAVKLSDNPEKATGDPREIARYIELFGESGRVAQPVYV